MRPKLLLFSVFVVCVAFAIASTVAKYDDSIDIDSDTDFPLLKESKSTTSAESFDGEGDDEDDDYGSGTVSDESASGSGESQVDVTVVTPSTKKPDTKTEQTTVNLNEITDSTEKPTHDVGDNELIDGPMDGNGESMAGGFSIRDDDEPKEDSPNAETLTEENNESVLRVLTTEVIAAVVVGAVCAVILIAFLVYRLRKRDEGSYALSDIGYKDTYKLQGDTGKEAFV